MKISFNPSNSNKNILDLIKNNKDIIFDLKGHSIFARGVEFKGTDTNTWRDIKINNVSIGSHTLDLQNGSNTTLTNTNGVVTINSTWRPVVDNLTSDSTTSSLSAKQGKVLKALIDGKSNSDHNHDGRYVKKSGDTMQGVLTIDTTNFGALTIKRNDDANSASIQFRGKSSVYGYIGLNNSTKDKQFLRWSSDTSRVYTILDTSSTYISNGKGVINGTTITQVDNATNSTNSTNARKLVNWYSARPTSLNAQFGDGSLRIFYATSSTTEGKPAEDSHILHLAWDNTGGYDAQLAVHARSGKVSTRAQNGGTWQPWKTLAFTTDIPSSLKNPYSFNVFGVVYDGSAAKTVTTSNFISQVNEGTSTITDGTMLIASYASNSGFADTNAVNVPYKRKAIHLWEYIKAKTDSLYATKGHNHDGRYVRAFGTSNDNIDSDWGQSFKTFDPIPLGTPPEKNPNISLLSIGENFNRRKQLAFIWDNDNIYYRRRIDSGFTNWRRLAFANEIPTSLKNPYALTISLNGTSQGPYDGSAAKNINITPGSIGAAVSNHSHDYLVVNSADDKSFNSAYHNFQVLYAGGGNGITGKPANVDAFGLFKFRAASGWSGQMLLANGGSLYIRSSEDAKMTNTLAWKTILDSSNYSGILDSRYYTESEVNSLLDAKLNRQNLSLHQYLSATDAAWYPLVWGGNAHINTSNSTGAVYKSYDKLCWQTSSQTLYATNIQTNNIKNLSIGGGIYWNSYVGSASDGSDAASITLVRSGVAGGTTLVLSQMNDTNDTIQFKTNTAARLYHNSYPILTTQNTYVSNNKGYINGLEITQVNNADTLDGAHLNGIFTGFSYAQSRLTATIGTVSKTVNVTGSYPSIGGVTMNTIASYGNCMGMANLASSNSNVNPNNQTSWHHFINMSYNTESTNMWQTQFAIKAGTTEVWVRSRAGGSISDSSAWAAPWVRLARITDNIANAYHLRINSANTWSTWYWAGQSGQPSWLWGSNDGTNMYVWNPSNFNVNTAQYLRSLGNQNCQTGRTQAYGDVYSYNTYNGNTGSPTTYSSVIGFGRGIAGTVEIAGGWCNTHLYWRSLRDCCEDWFPWRTVLDSSNYTKFIDNYYWANVKISTSSSTTTSPTVLNLTATNSIRMGNILLEHTNEINNSANDSIHLNLRNSGDVSLCAGGGKVGIGTMYPSQELYVLGYTHTEGFGMGIQYLSESLLPTISPGDGYTYRCLEIGRPTKVSCIIADKVPLSGVRGILLKFMQGFNGQIVLLKDLENYGSVNGYFWAMPSGCKIVSADSSNILINQNQISNIYDGRSRFFIYSSKYSAWIEFIYSNNY